MQGLRQPMDGVSSPLSEVRGQLDSLNKLLTIILFAVAAVAVGVFVFGLIFLGLAFKMRNKISQLLADRR